MTRLRRTYRARRRQTAPLVLLVALVGVFALVPSATAVHDLGLFQLDRDALDAAPATLPDDWETLDDGLGGADDFSGILADIGAGGGTQFQGGGSKDDLDITEWLWKAGEPLDKDDITNAYAAAYDNTLDTDNSDPGDLIIYFGLDRFSTAGSAQVGFWFLQDPNFGTGGVQAGGGTTFTGEHVDGDVLVQSNFSNGGVISNLTVYQWLNGALEEVTGVDASDCVPTPPATNEDDLACATVNQSSTTAPWPYTPKANEGSPGTFQTSAFFEGGINITQLIPNAGCFTAFMAETRSSTPFDARLKDFVVGDLDTCVRDVGVVKTPDAGTANAGSTITFSMTVSNLGDTDAEDVTLHDDLPNGSLNWSITTQPAGDPCAITGSVGSQDLDCDFGTLAVGATRTLTISSPTTAASCGAKPNTVTVSATGDIDATNNTDNGQITVQCGALRILKKSTKTGNPLVTDAGSGALFAVTGTASFTVRDNNDPSAGTRNDEDNTFGEVCVSGLAPGSYTVNESSPPTGYGGASETNVSYTVVANSTCTTATEITFTNPPLGEVVVDYNDLGSGETKAKIDCNKGTQPAPGDQTPNAFDDNVETYTSIPAGTTANPNVVTCMISIDP